jgi:hypothetical protein
MTRNKVLFACFGVFVGGLSVVSAGTSEYHLEIGDPVRKAKEVPVVIDVITDTRTGDFLSPVELASRLSDKRIVLVGESHINMDFHLAQLRVIEELHRAGRPVAIGLEMYPYTSQEYLDRWVEGLHVTTVCGCTPSTPRVRSWRRCARRVSTS